MERLIGGKRLAGPDGLQRVGQPLGVYAQRAGDDLGEAGPIDLDVPKRTREFPGQVAHTDLFAIDGTQPFGVLEEVATDHDATTFIDGHRSDHTNLHDHLRLGEKLAHLPVFLTVGTPIDGLGRAAQAVGDEVEQRGLAHVVASARVVVAGLIDDEVEARLEAHGAHRTFYIGDVDISQIHSTIFSSVISTRPIR